MPIVHFQSSSSNSDQTVEPECADQIYMHCSDTHVRLYSRAIVSLKADDLDMSGYLIYCFQILVLTLFLDKFQGHMWLKCAALLYFCINSGAVTV